MSDHFEALVQKSGEARIRTELSRCLTADGLLVNIWAEERVEDFMRSLGSGEALDVQIIGRHWLRPPKRNPMGKLEADESKLYVYDLSKSLGNLTSSDGIPYNFSTPGYPLVGDDSKPGRMSLGGGESLNMSFLRLVGISQQGGVNFVVRGVYTRDGIDRLGSQIARAANRFYLEFLKPYKLVVTVNTMPIPEGL